MTVREPLSLSRRERQIMDIVYENGEATGAEVMEALPQAPSYSAVRALLRILEEKGHLTHRVDGPRYVYRATVPQEEASASALQRLVRTFFGGSPSRAAAALIDMESADISPDELDKLAALIDNARQQGE